jgi:hypothetical protein
MPLQATCSAVNPRGCYSAGGTTSDSVEPKLEAMPPHGATSTVDCSPNITWAHRLKRVFAIETCRQCGDRLRLIASIEQPALIERILGHLGRTVGAVDPAHPSNAPPGRSRLI